MSGDQILVRILLATHPTRWRRRYGDEYAALLSDHLASGHPRPALIADILRGALDARLRSLGAFMTRSPMTTAIWAAGVFTIAGIGFQKLTEDQALGASAHRPAALGSSFVLLIVAAAIALGALVVASVPTAVAMLHGRSNGAWPYAAVPVVALALAYGVLRLALLLVDGGGAHSAPNIVAALIIVVAGLGVVVATAWSASTVLARVAAPMPPRLHRSALIILAAGMGVATLAGIAWGLALRDADITGFTVRDGVFDSPFVPSWIATLVVMAVATALAASAARRASLPAVAAA